MKKHFLLLFSLSLLSLAGQKHEEFGMHPDNLPVGVEIGSTAPQIELLNSEEQLFNLREKLDQGPVVIYFYRGNWCPYCSRQLANLTDSIHFILEEGATVVAISPESVDNLRESKSNTHGEIIFLRDSEKLVMQAYDVDFHVTEAYQDKISEAKGRSLKEHNEHEDVVFPVPATYVINREGQIVYRYFDINYRNRAPVSQVLKALRAL